MNTSFGYCLMGVLLLGCPLVQSQESLGPWKLGMTEAEANAAGPSLTFTTVRGQTGKEYRLGLVSSCQVLSQSVASVSLTITDGAVAAILLQGQSFEDFVSFSTYFEALVLAVCQDLRVTTGPSFAKTCVRRAEQYVDKNGAETLGISGHSGMGFNIDSRLKSFNGIDTRYYTCSITLTKSSSPTPAPTTSVPPSVPTPDSNTSTDSIWSLELPGSKEAAFKRSLTSVNALLVRPLEGSGNAASAMKLSVTAVKGRTDENVAFGFNQEVGEDMRRASEEVVRAVQIRHGQYPASTDVQFGFGDKWGGKDGPSAAVACALLLESLIEGFEIPTEFAVTGDLNADSTVQAVGGVADKVRGAMDLKCTVIGVPAANEEDLTDLVVEESLRRFLTAKIFTLRQLDDAIAIVHAEKQTEAQKAALADLAALQNEMATGGAAVLYAPTTSPRLETILATFPNSYTAKILLSASKRQVPARYSLAGTLVRIDDAMAPFSKTIEEIREGADITNYQFGRDNPLQKAKNSLGALKPKSDQRLLRVIDAEMALIDQFQRLLNANLKSSTVAQNYLAELRIAGERSDAEWQKIRDNKEIQDQFMQRGIQL